MTRHMPDRPQADPLKRYLEAAADATRSDTAVLVTALGTWREVQLVPLPPGLMERPDGTGRDNMAVIPVRMDWAICVCCKPLAATVLFTPESMGGLMGILPELARKAGIETSVLRVADQAAMWARNGNPDDAPPGTLGSLR